MSTRMPPEFSPGLALSASTEQLLVAGGDSRLRIDPLSLQNKYGCSPRPRPEALALGSCTASSISAIGLDAASRAHERLKTAGESPARLEGALERAYEGIRIGLVDVLALGDRDAAHVAITPSGTDAELMAVAFALGDRTRGLCNIVVGPTEVGSGTPIAAAARHFDARVPAGHRRVAGESVDRLFAAQVSLVTVNLRDEVGRARPVTSIDTEVERRVSSETGRGRRVLLHVVAHSKTGMYAPSWDAVARMRGRHGEALSVLVDAAQGRLSRRRLRDALRLGYMVLVTGSKFYGGPPFAGALLVPPRAHPERIGMTRWPRAFGEYFTAGQLPRSWARLRAGLPPTGNVGLILRWSAALAEMRAYYAVPSLSRWQALTAFESLVPKIFSDSSVISLAAVCKPAHGDEVMHGPETAVTVFPFTLTCKQCAWRHRVDGAALGKVYRWLNSDASWLLPGAVWHERKALREMFHIGQPVRIGADRRGDVSVLRVAMGGCLVVRLATDRGLGDDFSRRVDWFAQALRRLRHKLEIIAENLESMEARERGPQSARTGT